jgi:hypothetical protein
MRGHPTLIAACMTLMACPVLALERPDVTYKIFQFPADQIPRVDGKADDWTIVPDDYAYGTNLLVDDTKKHAQPDPKTLDVRVRVGWVKGMNRLYFLYEAYDDYWDFARPDLHNDTFEIVVDGDASGGPLIDQDHPDAWKPEAVGAERSVVDPRFDLSDAHAAFHGVHAQNYHVFTPAEGKDWTLAWGSPVWIKELPYANAACSYDFRPGQPGRLVLELWITPFDYAGPEGPVRAVESVLAENKLIGLAWAIIDYDDVNARGNNGFWNLSPKHTMYGNASQLLGFRLMPLEPAFRKPIDAQWSFTVIDRERRVVAFKDLSVGTVTSWKWDFGDGQTSTEQHPIHQYAQGGNIVVVLEVEGPAGTSRRAKVWDVQVK